MDDELAGGGAARASEFELDPGRMTELRRVAGDVATVRILEVFVETCTADLARLRAAAAAGDRDSVRRTAHAIRGGALAIGARALAAVCAAIEQEGAAPGPAASETVLDAARVTMAAVARQIAGIIAAGQGANPRRS